MADLRIDQTPLLASLPPEEREKVLASAREVHLPAGATLFSEGEAGDCLWVIQRGEIEILKATGGEEQHLLAVRGPGDVLGEMSLLVPEHHRTASGRARTAADLIEIDRAFVVDLLDRRPRLAIEMLREVVQRLRDSDNAIVLNLQTKNRELESAYHELRHAQEERVKRERLEQELQTARGIQESLLPKRMPAIPGWRLEAHWEPARAVGGDFYDALQLPDGRWIVTIGDVTDKGVPAALLMATTRTMLRAVAFELRAPGAILERTNELLLPDMPPKMFVTCQVLLLEPDEGRLVLANAGHPLPLRRSGEHVDELLATGMPLGLLPGMGYQECSACLAPGEELLLVSDGIIEAHAPDGEMFGLPRLRVLFGTLPSGAPLEAFCAAKTTFAGPEREQEDDVTLVRLGRLAPDPKQVSG